MTSAAENANSNPREQERNPTGYGHSDAIVPVVHPGKIHCVAYDAGSADAEHRKAKSECERFHTLLILTLVPKEPFKHFVDAIVCGAQVIVNAVHSGRGRGVLRSVRLLLLSENP
jgi:hypothetical protein